MSTTPSVFGRGFADPVLDSQAIFRAAMAAFAAPARSVAVTPPQLRLPQPLTPLAAALVLTLSDYETTLWLDPALATSADVTAFLRFNTGAVIVAEPAAAAFALISDVSAMQPLAAFGQGTAEYPDRSTTLILQVARIAATGFQFDGAGFETSRAFTASPMPADFAHQWRSNTALFPRGVDLVFSADHDLVALPRSSRLLEAGICT
jgi:alpha-D-ribose 1-methylphosphonate 5-triphosphate synthase subunit PhnH